MRELIISLLALSLLIPCAYADKAKKAAIAGNISSLIKQLGDDEFAKRESAGKKLAEMGASAIPALTKESRRKSPESSVRAFKIIVRQYNGGDETAKKKATNALKKIAKSGTAHADKAKKVLEPAKDNPGPGEGLSAKADIQVAGNAGINRRVSVMVQNGVTKVDAEENGKRVTILDDPNKGIMVEVTEEKAGKKETKKYEAGNAKELKEKHPEAHKLYQQYTANVQANNGNVSIKIESNTP
jgi:hypothetical protein